MGVGRASPLRDLPQRTGAVPVMTTLHHCLKVGAPKHGADCPWCRQPQEWHTAIQWDACLRAYGVFRHSLGCRSGLPSLLDERRRIFAESTVEIARMRLRHVLDGVDRLDDEGTN